MTGNRQLELNWQRSRKGTLFLRRGLHDTLGVVAQRENGTFKAFVPRTSDDDSAYLTEDEAVAALLAALGLVLS